MMQNGNLPDRVGQSRRNRERGKGHLETIYQESEKLLQRGKSCFQVKKPEEGLNKNIGAALDAGTRHDKEKGWA
jgi:hypothetical protein